MRSDSQPLCWEVSGATEWKFQKQETENSLFLSREAASLGKRFPPKRRELLPQWRGVMSQNYERLNQTTEKNQQLSTRNKLSVSTIIRGQMVRWQLNDDLEGIRKEKVMV
jgi:hypothetical protein